MLSVARRQDQDERAACGVAAAPWVVLGPAMGRRQTAGVRVAGGNKPTHILPAVISVEDTAGRALLVC